MSRMSFVAQTPGNGGAILRAYRNAVSVTSFDRVTGLYAYATERGARLLIEALVAECANWNAVTKRWVLSIDSGITEPNALRYLLRQRRTEVRVPYAEPLLARALRPLTYRFHPKTLLLERKTPQYTPMALLVGSANLTASGLCFNHEHVSVYVASGKGAVTFDPQFALYLQGLEAEVEAATQIDLSFVDRYAQMRPTTTVVEEDLDERVAAIDHAAPVVPLPMAAALASARSLWIEVNYVVQNRGPREEGNQIDMQRGTRVFFGFENRSLPRNSPIGTVRIVYEHHAADRNLRFGNNQMDKLDLPIPSVEGPPSYQDKTLLFTRQEDGSFRLMVGTAADIRTWKSNSAQQGTRYAMRGGREFGVFS